MLGSPQMQQPNAQDMLRVAQRYTDATLRLLLDTTVPASLESVVLAFSSRNAIATLNPLGRSETAASFALKASLPILRQALACSYKWSELSRVEEYDDRWNHSIRVQSDVRLDPTDALGRGRSASVRLLFFVMPRTPQLQSCVVHYEEVAGARSPISLVCSRALSQ